MRNGGPARDHDHDHEYMVPDMVPVELVPHYGFFMADLSYPALFMNCRVVSSKR